MGSGSPGGRTHGPSAGGGRPSCGNCRSNPPPKSGQPPTIPQYIPPSAVNFVRIATGAPASPSGFFGFTPQIGAAYLYLIDSYLLQHGIDDPVASTDFAALADLSAAYGAPVDVPAEEKIYPGEGWARAQALAAVAIPGPDGVAASIAFNTIADTLHAIGVLGDASASPGARMNGGIIFGMNALPMLKGPGEIVEIGEAWRAAEGVEPELVNLASAERTAHITVGDATGGGHMWPGAPGKTPFPEAWSADQIMHHVSDIATDPSLQWVQQTGQSGSLLTKAGAPARFFVTGVRDGVRIKVILEPAGEGIINHHGISVLARRRWICGRSKSGWQTS